MFWVGRPGCVGSVHAASQHVMQKIAVSGADRFISRLAPCCSDSQRLRFFSACARAAANGEPTLLTDYGEPRAMITSIKSDAVGQAVGISDPSEFKQRLLALPYALDVNF